MLHSAHWSELHALAFTSCFCSRNQPASARAASETCRMLACCNLACSQIKHSGCFELTLYRGKAVFGKNRPGTEGLALRVLLKWHHLERTSGREGGIQWTRHTRLVLRKMLPTASPIAMIFQKSYSGCARPTRRSRLAQATQC